MRYLAIAACMLCAATVPAWAEDQAEARNMALAGYSDLQGRSAYQPVIQQQDGRWIAYVGHHGGNALNPLTGRGEANGTSVVDVTDPASPRMLHHIPGAPGQGESGGAQMARVCAGSSLPHGLPGHHYLLRTYGSEAHEIWDVTAPAAPRRIAQIGGIGGTHKNFWECDSGVAYLVSGAPGWRTRRMTQVADLGDPARPRLLREFGLPREALGWSLFSFNFGVEIGQLMVVLLVSTLLAAIRRRNQLIGSRVAFAGSIVVIAAGTYWFVQRVFFPVGA